MRELMRDAAFAVNMDDGWGNAVAGYYGGPEAFHVWAVSDWERFPGLRKLPIWVGGRDGALEAENAVQALRGLGVPTGVWTALDLETRIDKTYVTGFGRVMNAAGYRVWVYGSASTVFANPQLDGYWVACYAGVGPFMYRPPAGKLVRATQYQSGQGFDSSTVKTYTYYMTKWWQ